MQGDQRSSHNTPSSPTEVPKYPLFLTPSHSNLHLQDPCGTYLARHFRREGRLYGEINTVTHLTIPLVSGEHGTLQVYTNINQTSTIIKIYQRPWPSKKRHLSKETEYALSHSRLSYSTFTPARLRPVPLAARMGPRKSCSEADQCVSSTCALPDISRCLSCTS